MAEKHYKNPYAERWVYVIGQNDGGLEKQMLRYEAQSAEDTETYPCACGGTFYYRPGVGGWWCSKCGELMK